MIKPSEIEKLDEAIKAHFVLKYELVAIDDEGHGIYQKRWMPSDLDFIRQWNQWRNSEFKKESEFKKWCDIAAEEDIIVRGLNDKKNNTFIALGLAGLAGFGLHWFLSSSPKQEDPVKNESDNTIARPTDLVKEFFSKGDSNK